MELARWAVIIVLAIIGFVLIYALVISGWLPALFTKSGNLLVPPKVQSIAIYLNV